MSAPGATRWARIAAATALVSFAAAWLATGGDAATPEPSQRVLLIRAPGLTWDRVAEAARAGRMPELAGIIGEGSAAGDLDSRGYSGTAEQIASAVTGRFPFHHGVHDDAGLASAASREDGSFRPAWDWLGERGARLVTLGFPPGATVGDDPARLLQADPRAHFFLYLDRPDPDRARPSGAPDGLTGLDRLLGRLARAAGEQTTFLLFSESRTGSGGFFLAWGRGVRHSFETHTVAPVDLAATLIYLTGLPLPQDLDGSVMLEILDESYAIRHERVFRP